MISTNSFVFVIYFLTLTPKTRSGSANEVSGVRFLYFVNPRIH
jgi:hypothetical protein